MDEFVPEQDLLYLIYNLQKALAKDFDERLAEFELTGAQGLLLFYLDKAVNDDHEVVHQNDIEKRFNLSKSTVSGLVDRLEKKELIERIPEKQFMRLLPTEKGMKIIEYFHKNRNKSIEKLTQGLSEDEVVELKSSINKLIKNLEREE